MAKLEWAVNINESSVNTRPTITCLLIMFIDHSSVCESEVGVTIDSDLVIVSKVRWVNWAWELG